MRARPGRGRGASALLKGARFTLFFIVSDAACSKVFVTGGRVSNAKNPQALRRLIGRVAVGGVGVVVAVVKSARLAAQRIATLRVHFLLQDGFKLNNLLSLKII